MSCNSARINAHRLSRQCRGDAYLHIKQLVEPYFSASPRGFLRMYAVSLKSKLLVSNIVDIPYPHSPCFTPCIKTPWSYFGTCRRSCAKDLPTV